MRVVIIEDEPYARQELKRLLNNVAPHVEVVKELDEVEQSVQWLKTNQLFDLVFLDIQLSDGLSFEIFKQVEMKKPVIFTTAYNQYALNAFELNSIDYLLKPIEEEALKKALNKLNSLQAQLGKEQTFVLPPQLIALLENNQSQYKKRFLSRIGDQFKYTPVEEIAYFIAEHNTVTLVAANGSKSIVNSSLEDLEKNVNPALFFRVNRSYIISIQAVVKAHKYFNNRLLLELMPKTTEQVLVGRLKADNFLNWLDK